MKKRQMLLCVTATSVVAAVACHDNRLGEPAEMGKVGVTADADTRIGRIAADQPDATPPPHPPTK